MVSGLVVEMCGWFLVTPASLLAVFLSFGFCVVPFQKRNKKAGKDASATRLVHVVMHGVYVVEAVCVGVDVSHPAENDGVEAAARFGAGFFGGDGAL